MLISRSVSLEGIMRRHANPAEGADRSELEVAKYDDGRKTTGIRTCVGQSKEETRGGTRIRFCNSSFGESRLGRRSLLLDAIVEEHIGRIASQRCTARQ